MYSSRSPSTTSKIRSDKKALDSRPRRPMHSRNCLLDMRYSQWVCQSRGFILPSKLILSFLYFYEMMLLAVSCLTIGLLGLNFLEPFTLSSSSLYNSIEGSSSSLQSSSLKASPLKFTKTHCEFFSNLFYKSSRSLCVNLVSFRLSFTVKDFFSLKLIRAFCACYLERKSLFDFLDGE